MKNVGVCLYTIKMARQQTPNDRLVTKGNASEILNEGGGQVWRKQILSTTQSNYGHHVFYPNVGYLNGVFPKKHSPTYT